MTEDTTDRASNPRRMVAWAGLIAGVGFVFGATDQYLGSLKPTVALGPWTVSVSQMSALWLLLPFVFGRREVRPGRAAAAGLLVTIFGLAGYLGMMLGPAEGLPADRVVPAAWAWIASNVVVIAGGLVTGPLFGWLGQRWRARRSWASAALVAGAFMLEPLARGASGRLLAPLWIWGLESVLGLGLAAAFLVARRRPARAVEPTG